MVQLLESTPYESNVYQKNKPRSTFLIHAVTICFCFVLFAMSIVLFTKVNSLTNYGNMQTDQLRAVINESKDQQDIISLLNDTLQSYFGQTQNVASQEKVLQNQYKSLNTGLNSMSQQVQNFSNGFQTVIQRELTRIVQNALQGNSSQNNQRAFKLLSSGWMTVFNGYQYKKTTRGQSWSQSRRTCRSWGGDLAVYGIQNMEYRRLILQTFSVRGRIWIGLKKIGANWNWVNGERAAPSAVFWGPGQPSTTNPHDSSEECVEIITSDESGLKFGNCANDHVCSFSQIALCEKVYSDS